jgi:hypothetical protein
MAIGNAVFSYMPPKRFRKMEDDLSCIPAFFANENDIVIVSKNVDEIWIEKMKSYGLKLPLFKKYEDIPLNQISFLRPWGWSPASHFYFRDLYKHTSEEFKQTCNSIWIDTFRDLYSRKMSRSVLQTVLESNTSPLFPTLEELPIICTSIEDVRQCVDSIGRVLLKAPWSSSGRGLYLLSPKEITEVNKQWIYGVLKNQKYVMAEIWKEKVCDFSFQYFISNTGDISFIGVTSFETDSRGNYQGSYIHFDSVLKNNPRLENFLNPVLLDIINNSLLDAISKSKISNDYYGYFGVDCMVYEDNYSYKIQPCVEINLRYNMGLLSLKLRDKFHSQARGIVYTEYVSNIHLFIKEKSIDNPVIIRDKLIYKGFIILSSSQEESGFITYVLL